MGSNDGYDEFVANMRRILEENFSTQVPATTRRSEGGLLDQHGLVVGLRPPIELCQRLGDQLLGLYAAAPGVWSIYNHITLHLTLGAVEDKTTAMISDRARAGHAALTQLINRQTGMPGMLRQARLLCSADTIILAGGPDERLYELRGLLTDDADPDVRAAGIKPGWSAGHMTLARARRPLNDTERAATQKWLDDIRLPQPLHFATLVAGLFQVISDDFAFHQRDIHKLTQ